VSCLVKHGTKRDVGEYLDGNMANLLIDQLQLLEQGPSQGKDDYEEFRTN